jgi:Plasmid encoded RepA protein
MRALRALKQSPLALDLYTWSTYRVFSVNRKQTPQFIPWEGLKTQMGSEYGTTKDFKKKALAALNKVRSVYPALKISPARGGFILHPGPTAVPALA